MGREEMRQASRGAAGVPGTDAASGQPRMGHWPVVATASAALS